MKYNMNWFVKNSFLGLKLKGFEIFKIIKVFRRSLVTSRSKSKQTEERVKFEKQKIRIFLLFSV